MEFRLGFGWLELIWLDSDRISIGIPIGFIKIRVKADLLFLEYGSIALIILL